MSQRRTCSRGHFWEAATLKADVPSMPPAACPVCGSPFELEEEDGTLNPIPATSLGDGAANFPSIPAPPLPVIPGYEILGVLGAGGMGCVYKARQVKLNRLVALKMILSVVPARPQDLYRFQTEAESLAALQHPHVVQIYEVGEVFQTPYLALEFVAGGSLAERLAGSPLPLEQAARLLETLARAVHAAHQRGIIHRDLKPGNILLRDGGADSADGLFPKITDFGIAKRIESHDSRTLDGAILGTPSYMAPEQAAGDVHAVGVLADVYSLGVILYETMTGQLPFQGLSTRATLDLVRHAEPAPPRRVKPTIPRDLETVCLKCLEKKPENRYPSAEALAADLRRFLNNEGLEARPPGPRERLVKWIRRRPTLATLTGVLLAASVLIAALGVWSHHKLRVAAERLDERYRFARQILNEAYTEAAEEILVDEPKSDPVRRAFLEKVLRFYEEFARDHDDDPAVRRETALAHFRLGQIRRALGDFPAAQADFDQALALQEKLHADDPDAADFRRDLANTLNWRGELVRESGRSLEVAEADYARALKIQSALVDADPKATGVRKELARTLYNLGIVAMDTAQADQARRQFDQAVEILDALNKADPDTVTTLHELSRSRVNRGILHKENDRFIEAEADYRGAIDLLTHLKRLSGARAVYKFEFALAKQNLGNLLWLRGRNKEAEAELHASRDSLAALVDDFPSRAGYRKKLANTLNSLGSVQTALGGDEGAERSWLRAVELLRALVDESASKLDYQKHLGLALGNLGWLRLKTWVERPDKADVQAARADLKEAVQLLRLSLDANPKSPEIRLALRNQYRNLAEAALRRKEPLAALDAAQALADLSAESAQDAYYAACFAARAVPLTTTGDPIADKGATDRCAQAAIGFLMAALESERPALARLPNEAAVFEPLVGHPEFLNLRRKLDSLAPPKPSP